LYADEPGSLQDTFALLHNVLWSKDLHTYVYMVEKMIEGKFTDFKHEPSKSKKEQQSFLEDVRNVVMIMFDEIKDTVLERENPMAKRPREVKRRTETIEKIKVMVEKRFSRFLDPRSYENQVSLSLNTFYPVTTLPIGTSFS
jgi:hypothetical protein